MYDYDFIIAGGGCAGLSLAYHLNQSRLHDAQVLIIDRENKTQNDRTWSFWTDQPVLLEHIVHKSWSQIEFVSDNYRQVHQLKHMRYKTIRGIDFYREVQSTLAANPHIHFLTGEISGIEDREDGALVQVNGKSYKARWVFDSRFNPQLYSPFAPGYHYLIQHFLGWIIQSKEKNFDPECMRLFDLRTEQHDEVRFFYILPFSENTALVEFTIFSKELLDDRESYTKELSVYLKDTLKIPDYHILEEEFGAIPMTDYDFAPRAGKHIVNIGVQGGMSKPSTGYAFLRIQRHSEALVHSLEKHGHPLDVPHGHHRFRIYDSMILNIMHRSGGQIKEIFTDMFKKNPMERVLRFLDEHTSFGEELQIMYSVPSKPFLKSIKNLFFGKKLVKE